METNEIMNNAEVIDTVAENATGLGLGAKIGIGFGIGAVVALGALAVKKLIIDPIKARKQHAALESAKSETDSKYIEVDRDREETEEE